ncbi:thiosulfate/3-mercaptopyruvate sulfurtransferase [Lutibacter oceani]|uniref:Thiosulfate/3-mercaptopyruvate sulfurtransferase n=1 Tax=Lutibacter oceani TaxID=1853311 RepID=A0A3D9RJ22_9FLAO|nr:rhodanese-like domain-containing protein [Lutibacter oceani]REE79883.1 thiosulfate/3-mercaptopyruvate sulfurtransferase [Lutibacter oceani]
MKKSIVTAKWLHRNLKTPHLIILDASQTENKSNLKTKLEGLQIKNARFFDLKNTFSDKHSNLPNMLPLPKEFEKECRKLGINKSSKIVVYDNLGIYTSPRVWWMFKIMGHNNIAVLNGGLPAWKNEGFELEHIQNKVYKSGDFEAIFNPNLVRNIDEIKSNLTKKNELVVDARSEGRFNGTTPEPRESLKSGHIPNSINLPYTTVLNNGKFKSKEKLTEIFKIPEIANKPLIFTCGSGITACILMLASEMVIENKKSVYDGFWTEWAATKNLPIHTKI